MSAGGGLYDQLQRENRRATRVLLGLGALLVALLVWLLVGYLATPIAFDPVTGPLVALGGTAFGLGATYLSMRAGPAIALRASKARPADRETYRELHNVLDEVCVSAGIAGTKPQLHIVDDPAPNAFATGLSLENSHIAVTTGLLERLPRYELRAVVAHEVAHIVNDDIKAVTVAVATAGVVALLADVLVRALWFGGARGGRRRGGGGGNAGAAQLIVLVVGLLAVVLAPIAAQLIRFAVSRQREYLADATAADVLRDPQSMVNALRRLEQDTTSLQRFEAATAHLWFEEPNDTKGEGQQARFARRFATHPSLQERIERLATLNAGTVRTDAPLPPRPAPAPGPSGMPPPPGTGSAGAAGPPSSSGFAPPSGAPFGTGETGRPPPPPPPASN